MIKAIFPAGAAAMIAVAAIAAAQAPAPPPFDAPTVALARAWIEGVRLSWPTGPDQAHLINVTATTTPEVAHAPTGATCRFWYRTGEITHPFHDSRHFECATFRDWFRVTTLIDYRETPAAVAAEPRHWWNYLGDPRADVATLASAQVQRLMDDLPPGISRTRAVARRWTAPDGRVFAYATADVVTPAGTPGNTPRRGFYRITVIDAGNAWIVTYRVYAPIFYRRQIEAMHAQGLRRLLRSLGRGPIGS